MKINTPISVGELVDKITILEIKSIMIKDDTKLSEVRNEKIQLDEELEKVSDPSFSKSQLFALKADLYQINLTLWRIEDGIREKERDNDFGPEFIRLARDVYYTNDERFEIKSKINQLTNSDVKEVKSYESYS